MPARSRRRLRPLVVPLVLTVIMVALALIVHDGVWMTVFLVIAVITFAPFVVALLSRLPGPRAKK